MSGLWWGAGATAVSGKDWGMTTKGPRGSSSRLLQLRDELEERVRVRTADLEKAVAENEELVSQLRQASEAKDEFLGCSHTSCGHR